MGLVEASAIVIEDIDVTFETDKVSVLISDTAATQPLHRPYVTRCVSSPPAGILARSGCPGGKDQAPGHCDSMWVAKLLWLRLPRRGIVRSSFPSGHLAGALGEWQLHLQKARILQFERPMPETLALHGQVCLQICRGNDETGFVDPFIASITLLQGFASVLISSIFLPFILLNTIDDVC